MLNLEYHKGQPCMFSASVCQEGFCSECIISIERPSQMTPPPTKRTNQFRFNRKVYPTELLDIQGIKST
jgi:hypothetical protein